MYNIPFQAINWDQVEKIQYHGEMGVATWQTLDFDGIRIRIVEYSPNYIADHWCQKGHIVYCLEGSFICRHQDQKIFELNHGMTYIVSDTLSSHLSISKNGAKLLIIDGEFLKLKME